MNLIYDYQIFTAQQFGGISRYFYELINHSKGFIDIKVTGCFSNNYYLNKTTYKKKQFLKEFSLKGKHRNKLKARVHAHAFNPPLNLKTIIDLQSIFYKSGQIHHFP